MNTQIICCALVIIGLFIVTGITTVCADNDSNISDVKNISDSNLTTNNTGIARLVNGNLTGNQTPEQDWQNLSQKTENEDEPAIFSGTEHPNEETDVKSSTPSGNPLIPKYAQGGVTIDIGASLMEGRGTDNNVSSQISFHDHTSALGYIRTIQKDFHYMSEVDPS